jgi:hypothetical protein
MKYYLNNLNGISNELSQETLRMEEKINHKSTSREFFKTLDETAKQTFNTNIKPAEKRYGRRMGNLKKLRTSVFVQKDNVPYSKCIPFFNIRQRVSVDKVSLLNN